MGKGNQENDIFYLQQKIKCPFAKNIRIQVTDLPTPNQSEGSEKIYLTAFSDFVLNGRKTGFQKAEYQAFAIQIPGNLVRTLHDLAKMMHTILQNIRANDSSTNVDLRCGIENPDWEFKFLDIPFFVVSFGPFYPENHSRYTFGQENGFLLFQPDILFHEFIPRKNRMEIHQKIRDIFIVSGQPYKPYDSSRSRAFEFVKPLNTSDDPVKWWEYPTNIS